MPVLAPTRFQFTPAGTFALVGRCVGDDGETLTKGDISTVTLAVYDLAGAAPTTDIYGGTGLGATEFFDSLQTGEAWDEDSLGYNFLKGIDPASDITGGAKAGHSYRFHLLVTTSLQGNHEHAWMGICKQA